MNRWTPLILIAIAGLTLVLPALKSSYVYNENGRLASGQLYLETGDYSSFRVNPPLVSLIGAIPATLGGAERPTRAELGIASFARDEYRAGTLFVEKNLRESRERLNTTELVLALFEAGTNYYDVNPPVLRNYDLATGGNISLSEITDGLSNTLLLSEGLQGFDNDCRGLTFRGAGAFFTAYCGPNSKNGDITESGIGECVSVDYANLPCEMGNSTLEPFRLAARSRHRNGVNAALADGSVRFFSDSVDIQTWRDLSSTHDGRAVSFE